MLREIDNLREIARRCLAGEPLDDDLSHWLGDALETYLTRRHCHIDEALGLKGAQGGVPWWLEEAIRERNAALSALVDSLPQARSTTALAKQVHCLAVRYAASSWRHDRGRDAMPQRYAGTPTEHLWRAFKSGAPMPISERQLRTIVAS